MNLKEISVKCETVEQKKLVTKIMSEELKCDIYNDGFKEPYIRYSTGDIIVSFETASIYKIIPYSDFIQHYPKYLIQSGDVVEHLKLGIMRVIQLGDELIAIGVIEYTYSTINDYSNNLIFGDGAILSIVRPTSARDLYLLEGKTIWQRKSENDIKREVIQVEIAKLTEELNKLGGK